MASVGHVFHLEVDGCIQGGHDHSVVKVQTGCVHEIEKDGESLGVYFGV